MDLATLAFAVISILLGGFGWLAPRYTMGALDLTPGPSSMGASEIRASVGALFVGLGVGVLILNSPTATIMLGFAWGGAAVGRATSLGLDGQSRKKWVYFLVEAVVAGAAIGLNWPG